jgi:hypothetical protein
MSQKGMMVFTVIAIALLVVSRITFGDEGFYWALGFLTSIMALIHLVVMLRTRNPIYLIFVLMYLFLSLTFLPPLAEHPGHLVFAIAASIFLVAQILVLISKKTNWRYREILELAAKPIETTADGFSSRPFPSGSAEYTRKDALELSRFLIKHVIVYPIIEEDRVVLVIPRYMWNYLFYFTRGYQKSTYVAFTYSGEVIVRIAEEDYKTYKEELTFDQLCTSLGDLFKRFMHLYRGGKASDIIMLLNSI